MSDPLQQIVESGQLAGAATLVWKNGAAHTTCFGWRDIERKLPVEHDTIFRIASMTNDRCPAGEFATAWAEAFRSRARIRFGCIGGAED